MQTTGIQFQHETNSTHHEAPPNSPSQQTTSSPMRSESFYTVNPADVSVYATTANTSTGAGALSRKARLTGKVNNLADRWAQKVNSWNVADSSRFQRCCWSCWTCCGKISYWNPKHRRNVAICCSMTAVLITYILMASIGMIATLGFTARVAHFEMFPSGSCNSTIPMSVTLQVQNPGFFGIGLGNINVQLLSFQNSSGTFGASPSLMSLSGTPIVQKPGAYNSMRTGSNSIQFSTEVVFSNPKMMGELASQFAQHTLNPATPGSLFLNAKLTATAITYLFGFPVPYSLAINKQIDLLNVKTQDGMTQFILNKIAPIQVSVSVSNVTALANSGMTASGSMNITGLSPTLKVFIPGMKFDIVDKTSSQMLASCTVNQTFIDNSGTVVAWINVQSVTNLTTAQQNALVNLTSALFNSNNNVSLVIQGSAVQPAGSSCVLSQIIQSISVATAFSSASASSASSSSLVAISSQSTEAGFSVTVKSSIVSFYVNGGIPQITVTQLTSDSNNFVNLEILGSIALNSSMPVSLSGPNLEIEITGRIQGITRTVAWITVNVSADSAVAKSASAVILAQIPASVFRPLINEISNTSSSFPSTVAFNFTTGPADLISTLVQGVLGQVNFTALVQSSTSSTIIASVVRSIGDVSIVSADPTNLDGVSQMSLSVKASVADFVITSFAPIMGIINRAQFTLPEISAATLTYVTGTNFTTLKSFALVDSSKWTLNIWLGNGTKSTGVSILNMTLSLNGTQSNAAQFGQVLFGYIFDSENGMVRLSSSPRSTSALVLDFYLQRSSATSSSGLNVISMSPLGIDKFNGLYTVRKLASDVAGNGLIFKQPCNFLGGIACPSSTSFTPLNYFNNSAFSYLGIPLQIEFNATTGLPAMSLPTISLQIDATPLVMDTYLWDVGPVVHVGAHQVIILTSISSRNTIVVQIYLDTRIKMKQDGIKSFVNTFTSSSPLGQMINAGNGVSDVTVALNPEASGSNLLSSMLSPVYAKMTLSGSLTGSLENMKVNATLASANPTMLSIGIEVTFDVTGPVPNVSLGNVTMQISTSGTNLISLSTGNISLHTGSNTVDLLLTFTNPTSLNSFIQSLIDSATAGNYANCEFSLAGSLGMYLPLQFSVKHTLDYLLGIIAKPILYKGLFYDATYNANNPTSIGGAVDGLMSNALSTAMQNALNSLFDTQTDVTSIYSVTIYNLVRSSNINVSNSMVDISLNDPDGAHGLLFSYPPDSHFDMFKVTQASTLVLNGAQFNSSRTLSFNGKFTLGLGSFVEALKRISSELANGRLCVNFDVGSTVNVASVSSPSSIYSQTLEFNVFHFLQYFGDIFLPTFISNYFNNCPL
eukprot:TRINITY_DN1695_c0_g1_i9.p1 TRINITY_DN1695_c0_g1~~TRINITY_DN1695_c0_g1_i9.p1  ORF type:complete len:1338 (-),score=336.79 TRINITY_DN1695_c0_g1_i9:50-4063(-)